MQHRHLHHFAARAVDLSASRTMVEEASKVLVARATTTCTNESDPGCTKPTQVPMLAIALAIVVPIVGIAVVLFFLHRRNQKKLAEEDKDKYRSMDFGLETKGGRVGVKKGPEMSVTDIEKEMNGTHGRGISLEHGSPYIMPVGLHGSRESFHSLSRSNQDPHDPYRPVTFMTDGASVRSSSRGYGKDNGSVYTASSAGTKGRNGDGLGLGLLQNAQRMSTSNPFHGESLSPDSTRSPVQFPDPSAQPLSPLNPRANDQFPAPKSPEIKEQFAAFKPTTDVPKIMIPDAEVKSKSVNKSPVDRAASFSPRIQSQQGVVSHAPSHSIVSTSSYGDAFQVTPPSPRQTQPTIHELPTPVAPAPLRPANDARLSIAEFGQNNNRLSMSLRPMPPAHDDPEENPEDRANRIRSFYKEYFDDSKPEPAGGHQYTDYYEDYSSEYLDGALYDPQGRGFVAAQPNAPFAEPIVRRAMTPPPRAPPRFRSGTVTGTGPHMSNGSMASSHYPPRNMSSMSGRLAAPTPKKPLPPPSALSSLPTPAKLNENSMIFDAADFAPPISYRDRQNGMRPDSPLGAPRPYSPAVQAHTPLASSYDDLAVMPSPHLLRRSGTFTALDFAPPPKFRNDGTPSRPGSAAGSVRSNRSAMSNNAQAAIRNGANRVSRIPKEVVTTRDNIMDQLRPQMSLVRGA
ncbi:hypothetical protein C7974DRAFT_410595 [Boeremia exigua]|uniref:uncharacterized protein n=1 Tax=Boeremia exigua TaxID=749465 RepID=UPI001E8C9F09|nr:uncharacterized protein C7974DRAFT_410595 [Boeremia exigua]KAH6639637.1 hypothetical protein C7974DRAFT_410595 [Boeremia exigua]